MQRGKHEDAHVAGKDHDKYSHDNKQLGHQADLDRNKQAKEGLHDATANAKSRAGGAPKKGGAGGKFTFGTVEDEIKMGMEEVEGEHNPPGQ